LFWLSIPKGFRTMLIASAVVHVLALVVALGAAQAGKSQKKPKQVISTQLVRLGKERDQKLLPRIAEPPPPATKAVAPQAKPEAKALPQKTKVPTKTAEKTVKSTNHVSDALKRLRREAEEPEGHEQGSVHGTVSRLSQSIASNRYAAEIHACVRQYFDLPGLSAEDVAGRTALVYIRFSNDGTFRETGISESSKLPRFDQAVLHAVRRCGKVSPPPEEIRDAVTKDGLEILFEP